MQITRERAMAVFNTCGWKSADGWDDERVASKLADVTELAPTGDEFDALSDELKADFEEIKKTTADGGKFEVVSDEQPKETADATPVEEETAKSDDKAEKSNKGQKKDKPKPKPKPKKEKVPAEERTKKMKARATRLHVAGEVLKSHKFPDEITPEMIKEVNDLYGTENAKESRVCLDFAWKAINGYTSKYSVAEEAEE